MDVPLANRPRLPEGMKAKRAVCVLAESPEAVGFLPDSVIF